MDVAEQLQHRLNAEARRTTHYYSDGVEVMLRHLPVLVCADGFKMSVQASRTHYCTPCDNVGPYTHVEVGYPSAVEPLLMPHIDRPDHDPTDTVYGWVPLDVVAAVVAKHGGLK